MSVVCNFAGLVLCAYSFQLQSADTILGMVDFGSSQPCSARRSCRELCWLCWAVKTWAFKVFQLLSHTPLQAAHEKQTKTRCA